MSPKFYAIVLVFGGFSSYAVAQTPITISSFLDSGGVSIANGGVKDAIQPITAVVPFLEVKSG